MNDLRIKAKKDAALAPEDRTDTIREASFPYRIADRYHCKGYLGGGGSGLVFKAWDDLLQRMVAIKFIRNPSFIARQRLVSEARALAKVNHPSVCSIYDIGEPVDEHSSLFMVMELIEGPRLTELAGQISTEAAIKIIYRLAEGLMELHAVGLVHNDINPGNVIIKQQDGHDPLPTLIDLSIAGTNSHPYRAHGFGITPLFAAPEQRESTLIHAEKRERVDIFSLGALLFFLLTGQAPSKTPEKRLKENNDRCPPELRRFVLKCIDPSPAKRFQSAGEVVQALGALRYQRNPWFPKRSVTVAVALMTVTAFATLQTHSWVDGSGNNPALEQQEALTTQAAAYALYAEQLQANSKQDEARKQAQKSVQYYRQAIALADPTNIRPVVQLTDFLLSHKVLFSTSELSALLLDTLAQLETERLSGENHLLAFTLARIYYHLAKLHSGQVHLTERWANRALSEIERAVERQPSSERYTQLQCRVQKHLDQSSTGTC